MWTLGRQVLLSAVQLVIKVIDDTFEARDLLLQIVTLSICHSSSTGGYLHVSVFHCIEVALLLLELVLVHVEGVLFAYTASATVHHYIQMRVISPSLYRTACLLSQSPFSPLTRYWQADPPILPLIHSSQALQFEATF